MIFFGTNGNFIRSLKASPLFCSLLMSPLTPNDRLLRYSSSARLLRLFEEWTPHFCSFNECYRNGVP